MGRTGFEPVKAKPEDLQSSPVGHLGICPNISEKNDPVFLSVLLRNTFQDDSK